MAARGDPPACPHLTGAPEVLFAVGARPGLVTCGPCFAEAVHQLPDNSDPRWVCDLCLERWDKCFMARAIVSMGLVVLSLDLCAPCAYSLTP